jgi:hypothetical protein
MSLLDFQTRVSSAHPDEAENIHPSKPIAQFLYNLGGFQQSSARKVVTTLNNGNELLKRRLAVATQELELTNKLLAVQ